MRWKIESKSFPISSPYQFFVPGGRNGDMRVSVSDGLNTARPQMFTFRILDLSLLLVRSKALDVFPMSKTPLTDANLIVAPADWRATREISYVVKRPPRQGRLLYRDVNSDKIVAIRNFTQSQVNASQILYEHDEPFANLTIYDSFQLEALADYATQSLDIVFHVRISVMASGIDRFVQSRPIMTDEGGMVIIQSSDLNTTGVWEFLNYHRMQSSGGNGGLLARPPSIKLQLASLPEHGYIVVNGIKARQGMRFRQTDVDNKFISYHHDHSDSREDHFGVSVFLEGDRSAGVGDVLLYSGVWNITVIPVNDQGFVLITDSPSMTVVQRQSRTLTREMLFTQDADNSPEEIVYEIINHPTSGRIVFEDNISTAASVNRFTQADLDSERIVYFHDGSLKPDQFYFRVSDGVYEPRYRHFRIVVIPLEVQLLNRTVVEIQQGTKMAYITSRNLGVATNGQRSLIRYNVTHAPRGGQITMNDAPASLFSQINVDNEEIVFRQTDMSLSNDTFYCTITNQDAALFDQRFEMRVRPLVRRKKPFVASLESKRPILQEHLDATQLSGLTSSNPVYFIQAPPHFGKIMRIVRASGSKRQKERSKRAVRDKEVWKFTHEDVKNGVIHFVPDPRAVRESGVDGSKGALNDSLRYKLAAPGVQPAVGEFGFRLVGENFPNPITEDVMTIDDQSKNPRSHQTDSASMNGNLVIAVTVIVTILLIIIVVMVALKCKRDMMKKSRRRRNGSVLSDPTKYSSDTLSTHHTHFGTAQRKLSCRSNGGTAAAAAINQDYENGILPLATSNMDAMGTNGRFAHISSNPGTLQRQQQKNTMKTTLLPPAGTTSNHHLPPRSSDSDSYLESSRSRETSPASSIPPGMPPFRVIPLCEAENDPFSGLAPPNGIHQNPFIRTSSNLGSDIGSNPGYNNAYPRSVSEAGSNAPSDNNTWGMMENGVHDGTLQRNGNGMGPPGSQPLLRKNQYWV